MTAEMTTVIGQFSIINGRWHNDAPNQVAVREPKSADGPAEARVIYLCWPKYAARPVPERPLNAS